METILERSGLGKKRYNLYVEETDEVNACAFGIRNICVTRGTLNVADNDPAFLKGILAHEMGHLSYRHTIVLFLLMAILIAAAAQAILSPIGKALHKMPVIGTTDRALSAVLGILKGAVLVEYTEMNQSSPDLYEAEVGLYRRVYPVRVDYQTEEVIEEGMP